MTVPVQQTIALVDDDRNILTSVSMTLESEGYRVQTYNDGSSALDGLAKATGPVAGFAEFDAAYLRGLAPPQNDPAFWKEQAKRFSSAQKKLTDKAQKGTAAELAKAAQDTETALSKEPKAKP